MKYKISKILFIIIFLSLNNFYAFGADKEVIDSYVDMDVVVLVKGSQRTLNVTLDLPFFDFHILPVLLIGTDSLTVTMSKKDSRGEIIWVAQKGYGYPKSDFTYSFTPQSATLSVTSLEYATILICSGILTWEQGPHNYKIMLSFYSHGTVH